MNLIKVKKPVLYWLFLWILLLVVSCGQENPSDCQTNKIKIITLSPHLAELAVSAGAVNNLVGVVSYSDFPESVKSIHNIGDAFKLDYERIVALQPDYILTWKGGTPIAVVNRLKSLRLTIIETEIKELADIPRVIQQIAQLTNSDNNKAKQFTQRLSQLKYKKRPIKTAFIETYHQPLYTISGKHWMSEAAQICGYQNVFSDLPQLSVPVTLEAVIEKRPQAIISLANKETNNWQKWQELPAVKNNNIIIIAPDLFSRPTMRLLDGIEQLCQYNPVE